MKFGTGRGPLPRAKFHVYRGNVSPLRGEEPIFGLLSKNNTGMAARRAGLPVIIVIVCDIAKCMVVTSEALEDQHLLTQLGCAKV